MVQLQGFNHSAGFFDRLGAAGRSDIFHLYAARAARGFGDGFAAIILPAYLLEIGFNSFEIGAVATAALLGSAVLTLAIGFLAPRFTSRTLLLTCAFLMVLTGVTLPNLQHILFILGIAFFGTINPTIGDIGVHIPLEQAILAGGTCDSDRTSISRAIASWVRCQSQQVRLSPACRTRLSRSAWPRAGRCESCSTSTLHSDYSALYFIHSFLAPR